MSYFSFRIQFGSDLKVRARMITIYSFYEFYLEKKCIQQVLENRQGQERHSGTGWKDGSRAYVCKAFNLEVSCNQHAHLPLKSLTRVCHHELPAAEACSKCKDTKNLRTEARLIPR